MPEKPPEKRTLAELLGKDGTPDAKDETIASLETAIQSLKDNHYEERFLWILACILLLDIYVFTQMENWAGPLVIGVLELVGIAILADRLQVNTVMPLIDKLTGFFRGAAKHD